MYFFFFFLSSPWRLVFILAVQKTLLNHVKLGFNITDETIASILSWLPREVEAAPSLRVFEGRFNASLSNLL